MLRLFKSIILCRLFHNGITKMAKRLAVFDFDHTIVDDNTDIAVRKLLKNEQIPDKVKVLYKKSGWTIYMREIFKLLYKYNISKTQIRNAIIAIPEVDNMKHLIKTIVNELNFDVIIISDSNSLFIKDWLEANYLNDYIYKVFTNPADFNQDGLLEIEMYHVQHTCTLSTINLCKGMIMEDFIKAQKDIGVDYQQVVYIGDGRNDFCPMLRLGENDIACPRQEYHCADIIKQSLKEKSKDVIKAKICLWKSGKDILAYIRKNNS